MHMKVHLVLYANNAPYTETQKKLANTVSEFTKYKVIIHLFDIEKIKQKKWFISIENLPKIKKRGYRDGYYNCWKAFIVRDVFGIMDNDDVLYYVDCSKYHLSGFEKCIDSLIEQCKKYDAIAGSCGDNVKNNTVNCCDNKYVWDTVMGEKDYDFNMYLNDKHVLNSWFLFAKTQKNKNFLDEWCLWSVYKNTPDNTPLVTYHHTVDQSIFTILVYKFGLKCFYHPNISHGKNKDRNIALSALNECIDNHLNIDDLFIILQK